MKESRSMKKVLLFILVFVLVLGTLCSCGSDVSDIAGVYKIEKNLYYSTLVDKAYNYDDSYTIEEKDGKNILFINHLGVNGEKVESEIGELKGFSVKKSNFDELIFGESWEDGSSEERLRNANKSAWKAEGDSETFYVMLQEDGTVLIASIKTKDGVKSCAYIRKIVK